MAPLLLTSPKSLVSGFAIKPDALCMRLRLSRHAAAAAAASERASKLWRRGWEINLLEMKFVLSHSLTHSLRLEQIPLAGDEDRDFSVQLDQH